MHERNSVPLAGSHIQRILFASAFQWRIYLGVTTTRACSIGLPFSK